MYFSMMLARQILYKKTKNQLKNVNMKNLVKYRLNRDFNSKYYKFSSNIFDYKIKYFFKFKR